MQVVATVVREVTQDPLRYLAIKHTVVEAMARERRLICELFQRCGRDELKFIVNVGLWGGGLLGFGQMAMWLVFNPPWSLAVGYAGLSSCQGCIRREGTSKAVPEAVAQAVGGGCQSGWGRLLSVTNAIEARTWRQGDSG